MKNYYILYCLILTSLTACVKKNAVSDVPATTTDGEIYIIKKGSHAASGSHFQLLRTSAIQCEVTFDSSAIYQSVNPENQEDVNKLIGFSDCNDEHHQNSARLGWSWNGHAVAIYAYAYVNGERMIRTITDVPVNETVKCSVSVSGDKYFFSVDNNRDSLPRHCTGYSNARYQLYPYFGGDEVAPHDITISIKNLGTSDDVD
jgi:hypothetical protein